MAKKHNEKAITPRKEDFSDWYLDIIKAADLAEHSEVKGAMIIKPYGYAIWEYFQQILDRKIKETGHQNVYFPLFIPESYLTKEKEHVEGFSPELAVVTHAGGKKLKEPLIVRPTSETLIYATYAKWIQSYRDLPLLLNQWANVVRWEMRPRLFLRTTEFLWQEGHTAHATEKDAEEETLKMLDQYKDFAENYLSISVVPGVKSESEKFAGALRTYTIEGMMQDKKALQMGTSHNLGQNFAKAFDVKFLDEKGKEQFCWQTSWGVSTRLIGAMIMSHSDDKGLVLPPAVAPHHVVIVPIYKDKDKSVVMKQVNAIFEKLETKGHRVWIDDREDLSLGNRLFEWEKKGVPIRIEIGKRDLDKKEVVVVRRDMGEKESIQISKLVAHVTGELEAMQKELLHANKTLRENNSYKVDDYKEFKKHIRGGGFVYAHWCGMEKCEAKIKEETKATIRVIPFDAKEEIGKCVKCGMDSGKRVVFAVAY